MNIKRSVKCEFSFYLVVSSSEAYKWLEVQNFKTTTFINKVHWLICNISCFFIAKYFSGTFASVEEQIP